MLEFFRQNPRATDALRGPLFEEKVIDFILELAKVEEKSVTPEQLAEEPEAGAAPTDQPRAAADQLLRRPTSLRSPTQPTATTK